MATDGPNVLLVILDSLRARNASVCGYHRETTPFLERFAQESTTYTQARAAAARSLPSHASIFTGYYPQEHGLHTLSKQISEGESVFAELREAGYETALFSDNPYITDLDTGLSDGFDEVHNNRDLFDEGISPSAFVEEAGLDYREFASEVLKSRSPVKSALNGLAWTLKWRSTGLLPERSVFTRGFTYAEQFDEWRRRRGDRAWAACINLMDTHVPFRPAPEYDNWQTSESRSVRQKADLESVDETETWKHALKMNAYDGTIRQADAVVESIVRGLKQEGELDETLVIITSDHGEGFGERSLFDGRQLLGHGGSVDEQVLHVPLLVRRPEQESPDTVSDPVSLAEVPDEIRSVVGGADADDRSGSFGTRGEAIAGARIGEEEVDVLYRTGDASVEKYVLSTETAYTERVHTVETSHRCSEEVPPSARERLKALGDASITVEGSEEVSEDARKRLTALGYTE